MENKEIMRHKHLVSLGQRKQLTGYGNGDGGGGLEEKISQSLRKLPSSTTSLFECYNIYR